MRRICVLALTILSSCYSKNRNCVVTANNILNEYPKKVYIVYKSKGVIKVISDSSINKIRRGVYYFSNDGELESYKFFDDSSAYSYNEEYDKEGRIIRHEGGALVQRRIREINEDSAFFKASFFSLNKFCKSLEILINDSIQLNVPFINDSSFSNIQTASFGLNTHNLKRFSILFTIQYRDKCTGRDTLVMDTTNLIKNPQLNFSSM